MNEELKIILVLTLIFIVEVVFSILVTRHLKQKLERKGRRSNGLDGNKILLKTEVLVLCPKMNCKVNVTKQCGGGAGERCQHFKHLGYHGYGVLVCCAFPQYADMEKETNIVRRSDYPKT